MIKWCNNESTGDKTSIPAGFSFPLSLTIVKRGFLDVPLCQSGVVRKHSSKHWQDKFTTLVTTTQPILHHRRAKMPFHIVEDYSTVIAT